VRATDRRLRISRGLDEESLRWLAVAVLPGSGVRLELVLAHNRRVRIASGVDTAGLSDLIKAAGQDTDARIELIFAGRAASHWPRCEREFRSCEP